MNFNLLENSKRFKKLNYMALGVRRVAPPRYMRHVKKLKINSCSIVISVVCFSRSLRFTNRPRRLIDLESYLQCKNGLIV